MKRIIAAVAAMLIGLAGTTVSAQSGYQVKGVVVDAAGPVIGATTVVFSCIGYATQTFKASAVPARLTITEDTQFLDDVVVIGYGTVKKTDLTGSVSTVKADEINKGVITTPADLLRGKTAGVVVTSGDGMPGSGATIRIRGGASINASNDPLIVIDGLPVSNDGLGGLADPLSSINPEDIESFSVLKDASATAIYGSRASNGVIVITTKKGSKTAGKVPHVAVDFTTSVNTIAKYNKLLDADGLRSLIRQHFGENSAAEAALGSANTDWQKEIYQTSRTYDGNISVNGRIAEFLPYRVSGGYTSQNGTLKGSKMDRATLAVNLAPSFFDNHLTVNANGKGTYAYNVYANQAAIGCANQFDPTKPVYDPSGLNGYTTWFDAAGNLNSMATMNPVGVLASTRDFADTYRFLGNTQFDYKVHGFEDLRLNLNLGLDWAYSDCFTEIGKGTEVSFHDKTESGGGSHKDYDYTRRNTTLEFYADYNKTFAEKHNVDVMGGYSWQHFWYNDHTLKYRIADNFEMANSEGKGELYLISFFGRANYGFADRYLITATLRADGTSRFQNHKWGIFPSVAFAWNVKNESFLKNVKDLSTLKFRLSWGETGQQAIGGYYGTFAKFLTINTPGSYYFVNGDNYVAPIVATEYSADLKWETTTTYNAGFDLGLWNDRLRLSTDVYQRDTRDILNNIPVPGLSNLSNYLDTNIGTMTNKGYEIDLTGVLVETKDMSWTAGVNMAYNNNKVTKLTASDENATGIEKGEVDGGITNKVQLIQVGYPMLSYYMYQQVYDSEGNPINGVYVDRNNDGQITPDDKYITRKPDPDYTFGFNTNFSWKNWTAALSGHASIGNWVYNNVASNTEMLADLWTNSFVSNRLVSATKSMFTQAQYVSDYYLEDGSFLKLDNFTIGYTFPKLFSLNADRSASLNIFGTVQNICTFTKYSGIDPEIFNGLDKTVYPRPRTFVMGLKLNF